VTDSSSQSRFQVRFDWGILGAERIAEGAHVIVWADALPTAGAPALPELPGEPAVISASVGSREAAAAWIIANQQRLGDRAIVAVVAAGTDEGGFAVEDFLAAGAVIDALGDVGIDFVSPEAAVAGAAFAGLRNASLHLLSASVTALALDPAVVTAAKVVSADPTLVVIRA
jgi:2-phosphosulfolactate phosphatase